MIMGIMYNSVPVGSLVVLPEEQRLQYLNSIMKLPQKVLDVLFSADTGAYTRGIAKSHRLPLERSSDIALMMIKLVLRETRVGQLPETLSAKLEIPMDKAQLISEEIIKDFYSPLQAELEEHWTRLERKGAQETGTQARDAGAKNVLNLKEEQKPPLPPWREQA